MYLPPPNEESRLDVLHGLIRAHPLGVWTTLLADGLVANHIPFDLDPARGEFGTLFGHVARANPLRKARANAFADLIVFQGPQAYITPSWYPSKQEHGEVVPTWNYAVVHVYGSPVFRDDREWIRSHVERLTARHESGQTHSWAVSDAPAEYIDRMLGTIVGVEIPISRIIGKWKMSQNRSKSDRAGVIEGLMSAGEPSAHEVGRIVEATLAIR